jgi:hypothetical protein
MLTCTLVAGVLALTAPALAGGPCCDKAKAENAWCSGCNHGFVFNVTIAKKALYDALAGMAPSAECEGCKKAAESGGICEKCHVGIAEGKAYKAMPAYYVASGKKMDPAAIKCAGCAAICKSGTAGWCEQCKGGLVAGHGFTDKEKYEKANNGLITIRLAAKSPCEGCSVAMVTDGTCEHCKVTFKEGKPEKGS